MLTRGLRAWFGDAGNYWGHNAIIRTRAFAECGGLPELPGKPPFGGLILSHDFVEAAFVRRGGWAVRMADDLAGSYEHAPPNLIELAARDRRWCQGNLQHTRLLGTAGLHPLSRLHLFMGVMSYLSSPLWLLFLLAGMSLALHAYLVPPDYFLDRWSLFPDWPRIDPERAMALFGLCMLVLFAPKLLGTAAFLGERAARGLRLRAFFSLLTEILLSALVAPIMMLVQTSAVAQILTGRDSGWNPQARDADRVPWALLWRFHARHMYAGILLAVAAGGDLLAAARLDEPGAPRSRARGAGLGASWAAPAPGGLSPASASSPRPRNAARRRSPAPPSGRPRRCAPRTPRRRGWRSSWPTRRRSPAIWPGSTRRRRGRWRTPDANLASALLKLADGLGPRSARPARGLRGARLRRARSPSSPTTGGQRPR